LELVAENRENAKKPKSERKKLEGGKWRAVASLLWPTLAAKDRPDTPEQLAVLLTQFRWVAREWLATRT
jgi:hypothetical protein